MDITLFLLCFAKTLALFVAFWLLLALVAYTFNTMGGDSHGEALAGAAEFSFWAPFVCLIVLVTSVRQEPDSTQAGDATTIPFEEVAGGATALIVYLCLSYLAKKRYELPKS